MRVGDPDGADAEEDLFLCLRVCVCGLYVDMGMSTTTAAAAAHHHHLPNPT